MILRGLCAIARPLRRALFAWKLYTRLHYSWRLAWIKAAR